MGAADSKSSATTTKQTGKLQSKEANLVPQTESPASKRTVKSFQATSQLRADAEEFQPESMKKASANKSEDPEWVKYLETITPEGALTQPPGKAVKEVGQPATKAPQERDWVVYLSKKYQERHGLASQASPVSATPGALNPITLQTSEYLKLLKANDSKPTQTRKVPTAANDPMSRLGHLGQLPVHRGQTVQNLKVDLSDAIDKIIRNQRESKLKRPGDKKEAGSDTALLRIVQMFESSGAGGAKVPAEEEPEEMPVMTAQDDINSDRMNRDQDLAQDAYWSEDEGAPRAILRASAHKLAHRPGGATGMAREYAMQDMGSDLDHMVATLLLRLRRLNDRHRTFEPDHAAKRYFVVGLKEVARAVRQNKVKCVVVAPDIEDSTSSGGLEERIRDILRSAYTQDVPTIFALTRLRIGRALGKTLKMSVMGILETTGASELYDETLSLAYEKRCSYIQRQKARSPAPKAPAAKGASKGQRGGKGQK